MSSVSSVEATSLFGQPLTPPQLDDETRAKFEANLRRAEQDLRAQPKSLDAIIWHGRRLAYLGRYREAIAAYTQGLTHHPNSYRLLRHRGHRYISTRRFPQALADLQRAAKLIAGVPDEVEPDGLPNAKSSPRSTTHTNIYYHLGLAHYLQGQLKPALAAYENCMAFSRNDDMRVATAYWQYLTLRRLGRAEAAGAVLKTIRERMDIIENDGYHQLLLAFKGTADPADLLKQQGDGLTSATIGYGVACWQLLEGRRKEAESAYARVLKGPVWAAFGFIAAEADLQRIRAR